MFTVKLATSRVENVARYSDRYAVCSSMDGLLVILLVAGMVCLSPAAESENATILPTGDSPVKKEGATRPPYLWQRTDTSLGLSNNGTIIWSLVFDPAKPKSYFHPLSTVEGNVLTGFEPKDHPWHRGLWWSWKFINGLNYWEEDPKTHASEGITELTHAKVEPRADFEASAEFHFSYHPPGGDAVMKETRKLTITRPDAEGRYRIDWTSEFTAGNAPVTLGRTPLPHEKDGKSYGGYAGLSLRLPLESNGWSVRTSAGQNTAVGGHGKAASWVDFSGPVGGITVCDHPDNLRHPSPWYLHDSPPMSFFSPAVLFNEPLILAAGQSLKLRYRVVIHSKPMSMEAIDIEYRGFALPTKPELSIPILKP